jgi:hypothetical protein
MPVLETAVDAPLPPPPSPLDGLGPILYTAAAVLGVVTGLAFGLLVIAWMEMPAV